MCSTADHLGRELAERTVLEHRHVARPRRPTADATRGRRGGGSPSLPLPRRRVAPVGPLPLRRNDSRPGPLALTATASSVWHANASIYSRACIGGDASCTRTAASCWRSPWSGFVLVRHRHRQRWGAAELQQLRLRVRPRVLAHVEPAAQGRCDLHGHPHRHRALLRRQRLPAGGEPRPGAAGRRPPRRRDPHRRTPPPAATAAQMVSGDGHRVLADRLAQHRLHRRAHALRRAPRGDPPAAADDRRGDR